MKDFIDERPNLINEIEQTRLELEDLQEQVKNTQNLLKIEKDSLWKIQKQKKLIIFRSDFRHQKVCLII